jgi:hypothetical protein
LDRFHPPGFLADFARRPDSAEDRAKAWSAIVSAWMDNAAEAYGTPEVPSRAAVNRFARSGLSVSPPSR